MLEFQTPNSCAAVQQHSTARRALRMRPRAESSIQSKAARGDLLKSKQGRLADSLTNSLRGNRSVLSFRFSRLALNELTVRSRVVKTNK